MSTKLMRNTLHRERLSAWWLIGAVVIVLLATLTPQPEWRIAQRPFFSSLHLPRSSGGWFDVAQNISLYIPLGLAAAAAGYGTLRIGLSAAALSLVIELTQFVIPGRDSSARDVLVNTIGAVVGSMIWTLPTGQIVQHTGTRVERWVSAALAPDTARASSLALWWAVGVSVIFLITAALLVPALPGDGLWIVSPVFDSASGPLRIGSNGHPGGHFAGAIDEVRIYDQPRTEQQIAEDMHRPVSDTSLDPSLIAAYAFDSEDGDKARDTSGHGRDGSLEATAWTPEGRVAGALQFDGKRSQVVVPHSEAFDLHEGMTLEAWIKPSAQQEPEPAVISRSGNRYYVDLSSSAGSFHAATGGRFGQIPDYAILPDALPANTWSHIAGTYDGQSLRMYVNGTLAAVHVHWSPHRGQTTVNGAQLNPGPAGDSGGLAAMLKGNVNLETRIACGQTTDREAPIFVIASLQDTQAFAMEARRSDVLMRPWTRARHLHLASPATQIPHALSGCRPGEAMTLSLQGPLQNPTVIRNGARLETNTASVGSGWGFVFHSELLPTWLQLVTTSLWLCSLLLPLGFWAGVRPASLLAMAIIAAATVAASWLFHVRPLSGFEMLAAAGGVLIGAMVKSLRADRFTLAASVRNAREFP